MHDGKPYLPGPGLFQRPAIFRVPDDTKSLQNHVSIDVKIQLPLGK